MTLDSVSRNAAYCEAVKEQAEAKSRKTGAAKPWRSASAAVIIGSLAAGRG